MAIDDSENKALSNEEEEESKSGMEAEPQGYAKEVVVALKEVVRRNFGIKGVGLIGGMSHRTRSGLSGCQEKHVPLATLLTPSCRV